MHMRFSMLAMALYLGLNAVPVHALTSDRSKPATIDADEVEFDFRTGTRTYKGNVVVVQGTLKITGDKIVVQYDDSGQEIQTATSWGTPATFKQRPDGKDADVYGEGNTIVLNETKNTLTLIENALMKQAGNTAQGKQIVYHMDTDKMTVQSGRQQQKEEGGEKATTLKEEKKPKRAHVTILPQDQPGAGGASGSGASTGSGTDGSSAAGTGTSSGGSGAEEATGGKTKKHEKKKE